MSLTQLCQTITTSQDFPLIEDYETGKRLVCLEYSKSAQEIKTYPSSTPTSLFALCWNINQRQSLSATMILPSKTSRYHLDFSNGSRTQLHTHDYIELAYVIEGEFHQQILGQHITFHKGELCLIDKNCLHQDYLMNSPALVLFLGLSNNMFNEIMDENITTQKIIAFLQAALLKQKNLQQYLHFKPTSSQKAEIEEYLFRLLAELQVYDAASPYLCKGLMMRIFRLLSTQYEFRLSKELRRTMNWVIFEEITDYIKKNFSSVTIQNLVEEFHFHEDYFNRLIKNKTGMTYSEYVHKIRIDYSKQLLADSKLTIDEIAEAVGYNNIGYFYKLFKEHTNLTPHQFRKAIGKPQ